ncbi:MAG: hypothetical protein ACJAVR_003179 [Paracoccaceae bacterium]|jgi:hypothetical protein
MAVTQRMQDGVQCNNRRVAAMPAPHHRRAQIAAVVSMLLVLGTLPAAAAMAGWPWETGPAAHHLDGALWMPVLSLMLAAAGVLRVVAQKG